MKVISSTGIGLTTKSQIINFISCSKAKLECLSSNCQVVLTFRFPARVRLLVFFTLTYFCFYVNPCNNNLTILARANSRATTAFTLSLELVIFSWFFSGRWFIKTNTITLLRKHFPKNSAQILLFFTGTIPTYQY